MGSTPSDAPCLATSDSLCWLLVDTSCGWATPSSVLREPGWEAQAFYRGPGSLAQGNLLAVGGEAEHPAIHSCAHAGNGGACVLFPLGAMSCPPASTICPPSYTWALPLLARVSCSCSLGQCEPICGAPRPPALRVQQGPDLFHG